MEKSNVRTAAGVLLLTRSQPREFLLMKHTRRWDLPKGHAEPGEFPRQTALRELEEETGISPNAIELDPTFEFVVEYQVQYRTDPRPVQKRVHYFLGWIEAPCDIHCTEHPSYQWFPWQPPHRIQRQTIDPLLQSLAEYLSH